MPVSRQISTTLFRCSKHLFKSAYYLRKIRYWVFSIVQIKRFLFPPYGFHLSKKWLRHPMIHTEDPMFYCTNALGAGRHIHMTQTALRNKHVNVVLDWLSFDSLASCHLTEKLCQRAAQPCTYNMAKEILYRKNQAYTSCNLCSIVSKCSSCSRMTRLSFRPCGLNVV